MKKRLLSAALALAMVLTLLPLSVFATDFSPNAEDPTDDVKSATGGVSVTYYAGNRTDLVGVDEGPGYYWKAKAQNADKKDVWHLVSAGFVVGSTWYASALDSAGKLRSATMTVVGSPDSWEVPSTTTGTLTLDVLGGTVAVTGVGASKLTSLKVTDSKYAAEQGFVAPDATYTRNRGVASIDSNSLSIDNNDRSFTLELDGVTTSTLAISMTGAATHSVKLSNGAVVGSVTLSGLPISGSTKAEAVQTLEVNAASDNAGNTVNNMTARACTIGTVQVTGKNSRVRLCNATKSDSSDVSLTGVGATLEVSGNSSLGGIKLVGKDSATDENGSAPNVTINAGTVGTIQAGTFTGTNKEACKTRSQIKLTSSSARAAGITLDKADVTITSGHAGDVTVKQGSVKVEGSNATAAKMELGETGATTFTVTGTGHNIAGINVKSGDNVTLTIPAEDSNTYDIVSNGLNTYVKHTIKGGTWKSSLSGVYDALDGNIKYELKKSNNNYTYYTGVQNDNRLGEALTAQAVGKYNRDPNGKNEIASYKYKLTYLPAPSSRGKSLDFMNGTTPWGRVSGVPEGARVWLPDKVDGVDVDVWTQVIGSGEDAVSNLTYDRNNRMYTMPPASATLNAGGGGASGSATKLTHASLSVLSGVDTALKASIGSNNVITLDGSLKVGTYNLSMELTTDVLETVAGSDGKQQYLKITVPVSIQCTDNGSNVVFGNPGSVSLGGGTYLGDGTSRLYMAGGKTSYTLASTIKVIPSEIALYAGDSSKYPVEVTVNVSRWNNDMKLQLKGIMEASASFEWASTAPAMLQAVNAVRGGATSSQITTWRNAANTTVWGWTNKNNPTNDQRDAQGYNQLILVPYLAVVVTDHNDGGKLTATFTPSYRIMAIHKDDTFALSGGSATTEAAHTAVQVYPTKQFTAPASGTSLGTLTGDMGTGVTIKFGGLTRDGEATTAFAGGNTVPVYLHQDDTYVYPVKRESSVPYFTVVVDHAGKNGGLGSIVIDTTAPLITLKKAEADAASAVTNRYYSSLQAAVDDVKDGGYIIVDQSYKDTTVNVTGEARTFKIQANGNTIVVANASGGLVEYGPVGTVYTVKLNRDTTPTASNRRVTVSTATGGSAAVSNNDAKTGETVTITLTPAAGYASSGVTVTTSDGKSVTTSGSGNTYTFTMPAAAVTVTPSFRSVQTAASSASVTVSSPSNGTAYTSAGNNQVTPGSTVTVTTSPSAGYRTMGLYVNGSTVAATRTGTNTFTFTVPANATNVVVTPRFDVNNGTVFEDVWSTEYYSAPVAWAVGKGITKGESTYVFGSENGCTREDMVTFLYRAANEPAVGNVANPFWDVQPGSYYYNAVMWAVSQGITNGVSDNQFGVGQLVTRGQAVTFLYRYEGKPAASSNSGFYDVNSREYYASAVSWANGKGVTNGTTTTTFSPEDNCKRCEIVTFMYRDITGNRA